MARKIDETLSRLLSQYDCNETDVWDCHGTWVAYHRTLEKIAAETNITFDMPTIIESDCGNGVVAICVAGHMDKRTEWSFGEAAPKNNKNAYPYAMAEKRAKDRVILKLVGLHGLVYSEEESDDFKRNGNGKQTEQTTSGGVTAMDPRTEVGPVVKSSAQSKKDGDWQIVKDAIDAATTLDELKSAMLATVEIRKKWTANWQNMIFEYHDAKQSELRDSENVVNIMGAG